MALLKGGLIGFGQVAEKAHWPVWKSRPDFEIVAVTDENPDRLSLAGNLLPGVKTYDSVASLLKDTRLDFVDIATPPALHTPQVLSALRQNLHVLCEKPLTLNSSDLSRIRTLAAEKGKTVFTVHNWSAAPIFAKLFELVGEGAVGPVEHVELHTLRSRPAAQALPGSWRTRSGGGGIWIDHGWHASYLVYRLIRQQPRRVASKLRRPGAGAIEEAATVFIDFPSATALIHLTWSTGYRSNWGMVYGRGGSIELRDDELVLRSGADEKRFSFPEKLSQGSAHPEWFDAMLGDFQKEITDPRSRFENLAEAGFCADLSQAVYSSTAAPKAAARRTARPLR